MVFKLHKRSEICKLFENFHHQGNYITDHKCFVL